MVSPFPLFGGAPFLILRSKRSSPTKRLYPECVRAFRIEPVELDRFQACVALFWGFYAALAQGGSVAAVTRSDPESRRVLAGRGAAACGGGEGREHREALGSWARLDDWITRVPVNLAPCLGRTGPPGPCGPGVKGRSVPRLVPGKVWLPTPIGVSSFSTTRNRVGVVSHSDLGFESALNVKQRGLAPRIVISLEYRREHRSRPGVPPAGSRRSAESCRSGHRSAARVRLNPRFT